MVVKMEKRIARFVVFLCVIAAGCSSPRIPADLVLRGGNVVTLDDRRPRAQAIALRAGRIIVVGSDRDIAGFVGPRTETVDLAGRLALPGFIEGHGHFMGLGESKTVLDLKTARNFEEIVARVGAATRVAEPGTWITGRGWHQDKWEEVPEDAVAGVPVHRRLSAVSPDHPVVLRHASGHAAFANARAMERAGIDRHTPDPPGGQIVRDAGGEPTGLLRELAQLPVVDARMRDLAGRPDADVERERIRYVELAGEDLLSKGITSFHDAGSSFETIDFFDRLAGRGELPVRLYVMVRGASHAALEQALADTRRIGAHGDYLTVRSIKLQIDGALGSHGAWLLEPYLDLPSSTGLALTPVEDIRRSAEIAIAHGYQVNTHAIGDRANREVLNVYEAVFAGHAAPADLRWRIEHAQHIHPDDVPRFAALGVIASMQGVHATSDGSWVPKRLGAERTRNGAYVWRDLLEAGAVVTNGTDVPVEDADPLASFYASVSRRLADGSRFTPDQRMTREEALRSYTTLNAYAAFEEDVKGSLTPGKLADIVVLSRDILSIPEDEIPSTRVDYTILGGRVVYRRPQGRSASIGPGRAWGAAVGDEPADVGPRGERPDRRDPPGAS